MNLGATQGDAHAPGRCRTMSIAEATAIPAPRRTRIAVRTLRMAGLIGGAGLLVLAGLLSLRFGSIGISTRDAWDAIFSYDANSYEQTVVRYLRAPRTVFALVVGCGLGISGAVMQGVTRNPLADPYILGVSGGASLGITTAVYFGQLTSPGAHIWFAFGGAAVASTLVYLIGSGGRGGGTPVRLVLAGVITGTLMYTWTSVLIYTDLDTREAMRYLLIGSVAGRSLEDYWITFPFILGGSLACLLMGHQLNVLNLGEDAARAVGMNTGRIRFVCTALTVVIAGGCVAAAGPIGFVGLAVPHMVRSLTGPDYRWVLAYAAIYGAIILLGADIIGRLVLKPSELEAGIVMQAVGAPFFIYLARRRSLPS
jgi:iron complex transport system permease protein